VSLDCFRFTSLCPVTGQPDWAAVTISYLPGTKLVESKSLKEYLNSFRMHGDFHEDVCRIICDDLVKCIAPRYLEVVGSFDSRGSIAIWPYAQYAKPGDAHAERVRDHRLLNYVPGAYAAKPVPISR
jgi:7-cyano-7-deazaguanine reductase